MHVQAAYLFRLLLLLCAAACSKPLSPLSESSVSDEELEDDEDEDEALDDDDGRPQLLVMSTVSATAAKSGRWI